MVLSNRFLFYFLQLSLLIFAAEYSYNTACNGIGKECTVRAMENGGVVDAADEDFSELSRRVKTIDSSYSLVNSSLRNLPRSRLLNTIAGNLKISGNRFLEYNGELERLERVDGSVVIKNNPLFQIPRSLYEKLCEQEKSSCNVDVTCRGDMYFNDETDIYNEELAKCTVLYGDVVVYGLKVNKYSSKMPTFIPFNIHTIYGAVRIANNEIENFGFLKSLRKIDYPYESGCALSVLSNQLMKRLGLVNLQEIVLHSQLSKAVCLAKNRLSDENKYYTINTDIEDQKVFKKIITSGNFEFDNATGSFDWGLKRYTYENSIFWLRVASCVLVGIGLLTYLIWGMDFKIGIIFYKAAAPKKSPQQQCDGQVNSTTTVSEDEMQREFEVLKKNSINSADIANKVVRDTAVFADKYFKKKNVAKQDLKAFTNESDVLKSQYATTGSEGRSTYVRM